MEPYLALPLICPIMALIIGFGMIALGFRQYREMQYVNNTPTSTIRGLAVGFAEVCGKIEPIETVSSIIEGKPAVVHRWELERFTGRRKGSDYWGGMAGGEKRKNFYIDDGTGKLLVDSNGAFIEIVPREAWRGTYASAPENVKRIFEEHNLGTGEAGRQYRLMECFLSPGETAYAIGTVQDRPGMYERGYENLIMAQNKGAGTKFFYISNKKERDVRSMYYFKIGFLVIFGLVFFLGGAFTLLVGSMIQALFSLKGL